MEDLQHEIECLKNELAVSNELNAKLQLEKEKLQADYNMVIDELQYYKGQTYAYSRCIDVIGSR